MFKVVKHSLYILILFGLFFSCDKDKKPDPINTPTIPVVTVPVQNTIYTCSTLPTPPANFGWRDSITDLNKSINCFMYNPINLNEVILIVNGDITGYNKMYSYNIPTQKLKYIATASHFPPQINKYGWIIYSTIDNNIYKVKCNGDSLTQLTFGYYTKDPKWDFTHTNFYYFQAANNIVPSQLLRANFKGGNVGNMEMNLPYTAVFKKTHAIIYLKIKENNLVLVKRNMDTKVEVELISGPYQPNAETVHFDNLTLDNEDENFYWSNSGGIFKCNLSTLKIDTIFKNCETVKFDNPIFQTIKPNEILFTCHTIKALNVFQLLHEYKALIYNTVTNELVEIKIFP